MKALVITPTTGSDELADAIDSVQAQTYQHVEHLLVIDGKKFESNFNRVLKKAKLKKPIHTSTLPFNTGSSGFYGHRIIAAFSHLVDHDYILFLDQDNWYEPNHVQTLVDKLEKFNYDWVHSLRKVHTKDREFICNDNCESLGRYPAYVNDKAFLVDTSSYLFKNEFIRKIGHIWDWGWGADRRFYTIVKDELQHRNYGCTGEHTLAYRLDGNDNSVTSDFFIQGNKEMEERYPGGFPWLQKYS